ncbi:MAG: PKD repeat protein [Parvicellaceae bacterium]|jgi:PKD repeat protein
MKKLYSLLFILAFAGTVSAQCSASFTLYDSSGTIYGFNTSTGAASTEWYVFDPSFNVEATYTSWDMIHTALVPGTPLLPSVYTVCVYAYDSLGAFCDSSCQAITLIGGGGSGSCAASFTSAIDSSGAGVYYFNGSASGGSAPYTYFWDFGDGTSGTALNEIHTYSVAGTYTVCLTITDATGCSNTTCNVITITFGGSGSGACNADFVAWPDSTGGVYFYNLSAGSGLNYAWDFGDGTTSSLQDPYHTYSAAGTYTACLLIWDGGTCSDTTCSTITVGGSGTTPPCNANFIWFPDSATSTVYLWNLAAGGPASAYFWDFGDGNTSTLQYPMHTYAVNGTYNVCLTVSDFACTSTYCDSIWVPLKASGFTINIVAPGGATAIHEQVLTLTNGVVYPNPVQESAQLKFTSTTTLDATISVSSIDGKKCNEQQLNVVNGENTVSLNTSNLSQGMYIVTVTSDVRLGTYKFMKN